MSPAPTGGPAFPQNDAAVNRINNEAGMTLRDWFATHAPAQIPEWFKHATVSWEIPPHPDYTKLEKPEHQELARQWQQDPCFDLPAELSWYGDKVNEHLAAKSQRKDADAAARMIQWRWHYADMMLEERSR